MLETLMTLSGARSDPRALLWFFEIAVALLSVLVLVRLEYLRHAAVVASPRSVTRTWIFAGSLLLLFAGLVLRRIVSFI